MLVRSLGLWAAVGNSSKFLLGQSISKFELALTHSLRYKTTGTVVYIFFVLFIASNGVWLPGSRGGRPEAFRCAVAVTHTRNG